MLDAVAYLGLFVFLTLFYIYFKEKKREKSKMPFHKDRLK